MVALSNTTWEHNHVMMDSAILLYETGIPIHLNIMRFTHLMTKVPPLPAPQQDCQSLN